MTGYPDRAPIAFGIGLEATVSLPDETSERDFRVKLRMRPWLGTMCTRWKLSSTMRVALFRDCRDHRPLPGWARQGLRSGGHPFGHASDRDRRRAGMTDDGDRALATRAAAGDRDAFAVLLERHYDRIFRLGARILGDTEEAADLAQDVCIALPARLASFRGESRFTTWLYRVVTNAARDALRRRAARRRGERGYAELDALERTLGAAHACESAWLRDALGRLSDELRATVVLVVEEGLRHAEAGEVLGVTEATVSWRMHEVRKRLRALAAEEEEEAR